jgi:hypothetical protein
MLSPSEIKKRAIEFAREHESDADEKSQAQNFWRDFFAVWGLSPQRIGVFESRARTLRGTVGFIDFFWPGTLLVEHKSRGKDLDAALRQALDYCSSGGLKDAELPRYIVVSDFARIRILELGAEPYAEFPLEALHENLHRFNFILGYEQRTYKDEDPVNIAAAERMGALHDDLKWNGYEGHELELFLVRLMFLFFADDTGIFPKDQFSFLMEHRTREDGSDLGSALEQVFQVLNTPQEKRMRNLDPDMALLPYVNGGLFSEHLPAPSFDAPMRQVFLRCCLFDWSRVSPAIFGSLFQSVMDAKERRNLGAHYTSEKNILKTIHGLFLDELRAEADKAAGNAPKLRALLAKIARLAFLDPACGCGNFLILAYRELRLLEIDIHKEIQRLEKHKYLDLELYRGIEVDAMFGIEIEEFPAQIARTALWIMDHLMNVRLSEEFGEYIVRLPLSSTPHIIQGNALRLDWREIVPPEKLSYILGNPPFIGKQFRTVEQNEGMELVFYNRVDGYGVLDFVTAWYALAAEFIQRTTVRCAFVSTNSITQGEQAGTFWPYLFSRGISIDFAHRTFRWTNEASGAAAVFCVIVGFSLKGIGPRPAVIHDYADPDAEPVPMKAANITPYLSAGADIVVTTRTKPLRQEAPQIVFGNMPNDGGFLLFTADEKNDFLEREPEAAKYVKRFVGSEEFINKINRYCLWLLDAAPSELKRLPLVLERIEAVRRTRSGSKREATKKLAMTPSLFGEIRQKPGRSLVIPSVSSERRPYIPMGFVDYAETIISNLCLFVPAATLYHFGVLESAMHMAWMRQVCGRLKSDYRYSNNLVYNNFPWPEMPGSGGGAPGEGAAEDAAQDAAGARGRLPPSAHFQKVEACAQAVLDARAEFPDSSLADLYDPLTMPAALAKAHRDLDTAVDKCYRKEPFQSELERVEFLFGLYEKYTAALTAGQSAVRKRDT